MSNKVVVISQPMFFPWIGLFEQIRLADVFFHYDDVQLPQGRSFINRVQIKTKDGIVWLTVPLRRDESKVLIKDALISNETNWKEKHIKLLANNYAKAQYKNEMLDLVNEVYSSNLDNISDFNILGIETVCKYLGFWENKKFLKSSDLNCTSTSSQHLLDVVRSEQGNIYVTGLGALNYIDYDLFEKNNVKIQYMDYQKVPYTQNYGDFNPYVSIIDAIAYHGKEAVKYIKSESKYWKEFKQ